MTETETTPERVIFRVYKEGDIIAIFPRMLGDNDPDTCGSYQHIGQHGACSPRQIIHATKNATPAQAAELKAELERIGYTLDVRKRLRYGDYKWRERELKRIRNT